MISSVVGSVVGNVDRSIADRARWIVCGWSSSYPQDSVLFFDADHGLVEQTGGAPFLSSVLGPQYVTQADGSVVNAGAVAPVDVFRWWYRDWRCGFRVCSF